MDRRKLTFKSLHKNLQLEKQSSERINSGISDKQINLHITDEVQNETHSFNDERLSNVESSVFKSLSNRSLIRNNSSLNKEDSLGRNNLIVTLSQNETSISTNNSQMLVKNISSGTNRSNNYLSRNNMSATNKSLTTTNLSVRKPVTQKRKISSSTTDSDSDLDSSSNKYMKKKKKHNEAITNTKIKYIEQSNNTNSSNRKLFSKNQASSTKTKMVSNISQNEKEEESRNKPSILINFLQKCGIVLRTNSIWLSMFIFCYCTYL